MNFAILGLGTALPPNCIPQAVAAEAAKRVCCQTEDQAALLPVLYRQTEIATRHMVFQQHVVQDVARGNVPYRTGGRDSVFLPADERDDHGPTTRQRMERYAKEAPPLAARAAGAALAQSGLAPGEITHLVTVSCTGFGAPGVDVALIRQLGLPATTERVHVGFMGCHGAINGLRAARGLTAADPSARVLLCAVELCSLHFHYGWDPKKVVANALFADGAAAVVGAPADAAPADAWRLAATGSCLVPDSEYAMTWNIGDHGFAMTLSTRVPGLIGTHLRPWLEGWLARHGLRLGDVASWAVHPGGPRILSAVERPLGLDESATAVSREVLSACGNMSSPTVLFILDRLRVRQAPRPCVALGFGPGLVAEVALFV
jgi:predicted naringenin-chalcone synthase